MKHNLQRKCLLFLMAMLYASNILTAQSVKRECISSFGAVVSGDKVTIEQTAGQCYSTLQGAESKTILLQGFQQPNSYLKSNSNESDLLLLEVSVFPNPAAYTFTISCSDEISKAGIAVTDIAGNALYSEMVSGLTSLSIDCHNWTDGIHLVTVTDAQGKSKTVRLIILN
ncbi:MAG: T9SS type A sorting domain-containing protein [Bacteroidales bacterium]